PGISAQPLSPFYSNLVESWAAGKGNTFAFSRPKVEELKAHTLILQPMPESAPPSAAPVRP
ncbi:MAG: hypothetical protein ABI565_13835, partial [Vicinamibacteria bacterium]